MAMLEWLIVLIFASAYSSYLSVIIYRMPRGANPFGIAPFGKKPQCSNCHTALKWYEYYPLPFLLLLRRHCRTCKQTIPSIFLFSDIIFLATLIANYYFYGLGEQFIVQLAYWSLLLITVFVWLQRLPIPSSVIIFTLTASLSHWLWQGTTLVEALTLIGARGVVILLVIMTLSKHSPTRLSSKLLNTIASIYAITCWLPLREAIGLGTTLGAINLVTSSRLLQRP